MGTACVRCAATASVGVLCTPCATAIAPCAGQLREHVASRALRAGAVGWVIDGFGVPHPLAARTTLGRQADADVVILHASISRDHAELRRLDDGWQLKDLGSRNHTHVDGARIGGRVMLPEVAMLRIGDVGLCFVGRALALDVTAGSSPTTAGGLNVRFDVRGALELCILGPDTDDAGGALMYRAPGALTWSELSLATLEFQLLRVLCDRPGECLSTKTLATRLPFHTRQPTDDNVRQLVRRFRQTLDAIGAVGLIDSVPNRGYRLGWAVVATP